MGGQRLCIPCGREAKRRDDSDVWHSFTQEGNGTFEIVTRTNG